MGSLTSAQIGELVGITNAEEFKTFLKEVVGVELLNAVVLGTIAEEFQLGTLEYVYEEGPPRLHQFLWDSTIEVPEDETETSRENTFIAQVLIQIEDDPSKTQQNAIYGGLIQIPIGGGVVDEQYLEFELLFQTKKSPTQTSKLIIVGQLAAVEDLGVALEDLVSEISPGLSDVIPVELLRDFGTQSSVIVVIDCPDQASLPPGATKKRSLLLSIGFNGCVKFNEIPLVCELIPPDILDSEFGLEFLVALQEFTRKQLIAINSFLEELEVPLKIKPPCNTTNVLKRGAAIGAHFNIGGYALAWLTPLSRPRTTPPAAGGSRSLTPQSGGNLRLVSSQNTTSPEEEFPITIAENGAWLTVQKSFLDVLYFEKVGLVYKQGEIHLTPLFIVEVSRLVLTLNGLSISSPLTNFSASFNMNGFGLEIITRGLEIGGTFLVVEKSDGDGKPIYDEYLGNVVIGMKTGTGGKKALSISAIGSFAKFPKSSDFGLFLYLTANYPFGGPPFFFVTGISGGFGYNYDLTMPTLEELVTFPFVDEAIQNKGPVDPAHTAAIIAEELETLAATNYIAPKIGAGFGAIGLEFTCFKIIDGSGLVTIAIDSSTFELDFVATVTLMLPTTIESRFEPLAVAEKVMLTRFAPSEGVLMIQGQLTPSSYFLSRECHLTGGYAYGLWFSGSRAGDFVVTQGGYHPCFQIPDYYPDVPRLGYSWQIDNNAFTTAQVYFALCGHGVMAGGLFAIAYKLGSLWAEFDAGVDLLLGWKPGERKKMWGRKAMLACILR